ncbi:MAG: hypothetical protein AAGF15_12565, partial [Pseudomonadota bacterium]
MPFTLSLPPLGRPLKSAASFRLVTLASAIAFITSALPGFAQAEDAALAQPEWIAISNGYAKKALDELAKQSPEGAGSLGVDGLDEEIFDFSNGFRDRARKASAKLLKTYEKDLAAAEHPKVKQDIQILIKSVEDSMETDRLTSEVMLPYHNVT